jgi:hypothetical protein
VSGYQVVSSESALNSSDAQFAAVVCPAGKRPVGGGAGAIGSPDFVLIRTEPDPTGGPAWVAEGVETDPTNDLHNVRVWAICAVVN